MILGKHDKKGLKFTMYFQMYFGSVFGTCSFYNLSLICKNNEVSTGVQSGSAETVAKSVEELCVLLGLSLSCCVNESLDTG